MMGIGMEITLIVKPDAGLHYAVERRGVISDPHGAQAYRH
jgi:hypothetical protein